MHVRPDALREALTRQDHRAALLDTWVREGWPAVRRRRSPADPVGHVPLGIPLPPSYGKTRIALSAPSDDTLDVVSPPALREIAPAVPSRWRETTTSLLRLADTLDTEPHVFGSFAWAWITGLAYVDDTSDLDLIWPLPPRPDALLAGLTAIETDAPGALDGEIVSPVDNGAVNWRELRDGGDQLLVKGCDDVALLPRATFLSTTHA